MKRGEPPKRKTPLARSTKPLKRTAIKGHARVETAEERRERNRRRNERQNKADPALPDGITLPEGQKIVKVRAGGLCEVRASAECTGKHEATHHRKSRRFRDHRPCNLLASCNNCHTDAEDSIHRNPARGHERGWLVWSHEDPAKVLVDGRDPWVLG